MTNVIVKKEHPSHAEQIAARCVHFTGIGNDACEAGVRYDNVRVEHEAVAYRRGAREYTARVSYPCNHGLNYCGAVCDKARFPSPEEVAGEVAKSNREVERMFSARAAIVAHIKQTGERNGVIECPTCHKRLGYGQASNGHIRAHCETPECTAWME